MIYNIKAKTIDGIKLSWSEADILEVLIKMNGETLPLKEIANQIDKKYKLTSYKTSVSGLRKNMFTLRKKVDGLIKNKPGFGYLIDEEIKISKDPPEKEPKLTYEYGLVVGTKRERDYWKNKINEKIEELKQAYEESKDEDGASPYYYPDYTIDKLEELLKGE